MTEAATLLRDLKAALMDGAPHRATGWEWCQALDVVVAAVRKEAIGPVSGPAERADIHRRLEDLLVASYGEVSDMDAFIDEMSQRGLYVLDRGAYDELVKRGRT